MGSLDSGCTAGEAVERDVGVDGGKEFREEMDLRFNLKTLPSGGLNELQKRRASVTSVSSVVDSVRTSSVFAPAERTVEAPALQAIETPLAHYATLRLDSSAGRTYFRPKTR